MKEKEKDFSSILAEELSNLFAELKKDFWTKLFEDVLRRHTYQNDFYLTGKRLSKEETVAQFRSFVIGLCQKYGLEYSEWDAPARTEFKIKFCYNDNKKTLFNELSIAISRNGMTLRVLPLVPIFKNYWIEEYVLVETIIEELCDELFNFKKDSFEEIKEEYVRVRAGARKLTYKTVEIAQNSISAIYCSHITKKRSMCQRKLYSDLFINGRYVRIFHQDFLENPNVLTKEF